MGDGLEKGCFSWPCSAEGADPAGLRILGEELALLLGGIDLEKTRARDWWRKAA